MTRSNFPFYSYSLPVSKYVDFPKYFDTKGVQFFLIENEGSTRRRYLCRV
jgi:hypothetical protein